LGLKTPRTRELETATIAYRVEVSTRYQFWKNGHYTVVHFKNPGQLSLSTVPKDPNAKLEFENMRFDLEVTLADVGGFFIYRIIYDGACLIEGLVDDLDDDQKILAIQRYHSS